LLVLVNPVGGSGRAQELFEAEAAPVLEAAGIANVRAFEHCQRSERCRCRTR
jgi:hypothetical protein